MVSHCLTWNNFPTGRIIQKFDIAEEELEKNLDQVLLYNFIASGMGIGQHSMCMYCLFVDILSKKNVGSRISWMSVPGKLPVVTNSVCL